MYAVIKDKRVSSLTWFSQIGAELSWWFYKNQEYETDV